MNIFRSSLWDKYVNSCVDSEFYIHSCTKLVDTKKALKELYEGIDSYSGHLKLKRASKETKSALKIKTTQDIFELCKANKSTYIVEGLETIPGILQNLAMHLSNFYLAEVFINAFFSDENSQPSPLHYDYHDLINIQLLGKKHWVVYDKAEDVQFTPSGYIINQNTTKNVVYKGQMKVNDVFSIPKGFAHDVKSISCQSVHLAIGLRFDTLEDIAIMKFRSEASSKLKAPIFKELKGYTENSYFSEIKSTNSSINHNDFVQYILASQKMPKRDAQISSESLIFDRGIFSVTTNTDGSYTLHLPMEIHPEVSINKSSFSPGELVLPKETKPIVEHILKNGSISKTFLNKYFNIETSNALFSILSSLSIAY